MSDDELKELSDFAYWGASNEYPFIGEQAANVRNGIIKLLAENDRLRADLSAIRKHEEAKALVVR